MYSLYDYLPISSETLFCCFFQRKRNPSYITTFKSYKVYRGESQTFTVTATTYKQSPTYIWKLLIPWKMYPSGPKSFIQNDESRKWMFPRIFSYRIVLVHAGIFMSCPHVCLQNDPCSPTCAHPRHPVEMLLWLQPTPCWVQRPSLLHPVCSNHASRDWEDFPLRSMLSIRVCHQKMITVIIYSFPYNFVSLFPLRVVHLRV